MAITTSDGVPAGAGAGSVVRVAASGDIHLGRPEDAERWRTAFADVAERVDLILLAGDLTTHGEPEQAGYVAEAVQDVDVPVLSVLGNHDWHVNRRDEMVAALEGDGRIDVIDGGARVLDLCGTQVGVAGVKGFGGGFPGAHIPDFGEPLMRALYTEAIEQAGALDAGLRDIALCPLRIALLHYAPITATLEGERSDIWPMLGTDRLAVPLREHRPDLVLHGHAHAGTFAGDLDGVPVYNVSVPVLGEDFWVFELSGVTRSPSEVH